MRRRPAAPPLDQDMGQLSGRLSDSRNNAREFARVQTTRLTARDEAIIRTLSAKVRCLDVSLVCRRWWRESRSKVMAKRRLEALAEDGWLTKRAMLARPRENPHSPIISWQPGALAPDFGPVSYFLKTRFPEPARHTPIFFATQKSMNKFGGSAGRCPRPSEVTHDLGLAAVYLFIDAHSPERACGWISESAIQTGKRKAGEKIPDALIRETTGQYTAIEFGGEYGKAKLEAFHNYCQESSMGYELW